MDIERAIATHRAVRTFQDVPLADDDLRAILHAGRRAGSSKNLQRWVFIVVTQRETLRALAGVGGSADHLAGAAAAVALLTPDPEVPGRPHSIMWDLGRAAQNMTLVAWGRGIGSVPATVYDHASAREILGYPADQRCEYILSFGYPLDATDLTRPLRAGGRKPLDEIVRRDRW